jgi:hypothetical protein
LDIPTSPEYPIKKGIEEKNKKAIKNKKPGEPSAIQLK